MDSVTFTLGSIVLLAPVGLFTAIALPMLFGLRVSEAWVVRLTKIAIAVGFISLIGLTVTGSNQLALPLNLIIGNWVVLDSAQCHFHFRLEFVFDVLSLTFGILTFILCGVIGIFASNYMHREPGFHRFFLLFAMFLLGMTLAVFAATIESLFLGWELVGLSSALLVAFFHERVAPVENGLRVWSVYRISDAAFLIAAVVLHELRAEGEFANLTGSAGWPNGESGLTMGQASFVGLMLIVAAAGKSALIPFSGWLPRAMEGPTPSGAVFYGALSVHLGAYLLLRISPVLNQAWWLSVSLIVLGLGTATFATISGRVQSDIKSALALASLAQVGLIVAEIGLGFRYLALGHIVGHAFLRTLQLLRAPTLLRDYHGWENAIGTRISNSVQRLEIFLPTKVSTALYRWGLERGYLDHLIDGWIVRPFVGFFRRCDMVEKRWTDFLSGQPSRESDRSQSHGDGIEEL